MCRGGGAVWDEGREFRVAGTGVLGLGSRV